MRRDAILRRVLTLNRGGLSLQTAANPLVFIEGVSVCQDVLASYKTQKPLDERYVDLSLRNIV